MNMFWDKNKFEKKVSQLNSILTQSFRNVRGDTNNIFQWLDYFYKKSIEQEKLLNKLQLELSYMPKSKDDLRRVLDKYYSYEPILKKIKEVDEKVEAINRQKILEDEVLVRRIRELDERVDALKSQKVFETQKSPYELGEIKARLERLEQKKAVIREKIIKRITKNSKEYIKSIIISYIKKYEKISALQLKEMVVEEQGLCSKSSFYRILEEIEYMDDIATLKKGKEKHFMSKKLKLQ